MPWSRLAVLHMPIHPTMSLESFAAARQKCLHVLRQDMPDPSHVSGWCQHLRAMQLVLRNALSAVDRVIEEDDERIRADVQNAGILHDLHTLATRADADTVLIPIRSWSSTADAVRANFPTFDWSKFTLFQVSARMTYKRPDAEGSSNSDGMQHIPFRLTKMTDLDTSESVDVDDFVPELLLLEDAVRDRARSIRLEKDLRLFDVISWWPHYVEVDMGFYAVLPMTHVLARALALSE